MSFAHQNTPIGDNTVHHLTKKLAPKNRNVLGWPLYLWVRLKTHDRIEWSILAKNYSGSERMAITMSARANFHAQLILVTHSQHTKATRVEENQLLKKIFLICCSQVWIVWNSWNHDDQIFFCFLAFNRLLLFQLTLIFNGLRNLEEK